MNHISVDQLINLAMSPIVLGAPLLPFKFLSFLPLSFILDRLLCAAGVLSSRQVEIHSVEVLHAEMHVEEMHNSPTITPKMFSSVGTCGLQLANLMWVVTLTHLVT